MEDLKIFENNLVQKKESYIEKYLEYIDVSENSSKEYHTGLKMFFEYCVKNNIKDIQRQDIIGYREYLKQQGKSANTINLYLTSIKNFFKWLDYEEIYKDISQNIKSLPIESTHIRESLNEEQIKELLSNCQNDKESLIISIAVTTGIRCNEMCNIRLKDFVMKDNKVCLYVLGKARQGMKTDFVVISDKLLEQIKSYAENNNITDYLFTSNSNNSKGKPLSTRSMREIVNKIYERANMKTENLVFHSLRHSNATLSIKNGVDIREVSQNLRHKSITTTMRYLHDLEMTDNKCSDTISNLLFA